MTKDGDELFYPGQRVVVIKDDPSGRYRMLDEGVVLVNEYSEKYDAKVMLDGEEPSLLEVLTGKKQPGVARIYYFYKEEILDADELWSMMVAAEAKGHVERFTKPDGTIGFKPTQYGYNMLRAVEGRQ